MSNSDANGELEKITSRLEKLAIDSSVSAQRLRTKKVEADKLRRDIEREKDELAEIQQRIQALKCTRDKVIAANETPTARDGAGRVISVGETVLIANRYTNFSTQFPRYKACREPRERGASVQYYDIDKFGIVTSIQRTGRTNGPANKIHFVTDSGFETWRKPKNLLVYNGEGGDLVDEGNEVFHKTHSE